MRTVAALVICLVDVFPGMGGETLWKALIGGGTMVLTDTGLTEVGVGKAAGDMAGE
jgi:hypothetical protein